MAACAAGKLDNAFWKFSFAVYAAPGVADECLAMQESHGIDVNVLLFCAWLAAARKVALTPRDIAAIGAQVGAWHDSAVKPLRGVRRYMKNVPGGDVAALRTRVKAAELEAEQIEQAMLFAYADGIGREEGRRLCPPRFWQTSKRTCARKAIAVPAARTCRCVPCVRQYWPCPRQS